MIRPDQRLAGNQYAHGHMCGNKATKTYLAWHNMRRRCFDPDNGKYAIYGGRGITVCERWSEFAAFLADMGECPVGMTLDRREVNGNYEPGNCRWATLREQANNRRNNVFITYLGETLTIAQWSRKTGCDQETIRQRFLRGVPVDQLMEPAHKPKTHCPSGHPLDGANTRITKKGHRICKICQRLANKKWEAKNKPC